MGQLEDMTVFIRVVDAGGISRAAEQLGIAKSAVSRRLVDLETRLGIRLLNRTTRTSSLTEAGRGFYERSIKIVDDVAELNALAKDSNTRLEGTINLAAPLSFGLSHLAPAIDDFLSLHPELSININFSDRQINLNGVSTWLYLPQYLVVIFRFLMNNPQYVGIGTAKWRPRKFN